MLCLRVVRVDDDLVLQRLNRLLLVELHVQEGTIVILYSRYFEDICDFMRNLFITDVLQNCLMLAPYKMFQYPHRAVV